MLRHSFCSLHTGVRMHYVEALPPQGLTGETLLLVHGFPDSWYGWRKQIPELALAGHRVIVPDMRGYGETTPVFKDDASRYSTENLLGDLLALMDCLLLKKVVICGHDWGGTVVWNFALHYPDRCKGVAAFCTPFFPWRDSNPWPKMLDNPGRFDYQLYFHTREAEQELERDPEFTVKAIIRGTSKKDHDAIPEYVSTPLRPTADGGYLVKIPRDVPKSTILTDNDVAYYAWQLKQSGFHGILSWYRNVPRNWRWNAKTEGLRVTAPSLMVTAANDVVLPPSMVKGMEPWFDDLTLQHVEEAGHWVLQEQPERVNSLLIGWLASKFPPRKVQSAL